MQVRRYDPATDFVFVAELGSGWDATYDPDLFPNTGVVIPGVGAYFVYCTNSKVCWLENLVIRKGLDPELKNEALALLTTEACRLAKDLGFKVAYATTDNSSVVARATGHNAKAQPNQILLTLRFK